MGEDAGMRSFDTDIKPLFRDGDRRAMRYAFDLWSYDDVKEHAEDILGRVEDGSMPCDMPWEEDLVDLFRSWLDDGMAP